MKAFDNVVEERENIVVGDVTSENRKKSGVVYGSEELPDVAFKNPECFRVISACLKCVAFKLPHRLVRALPEAAGVGVGYERAVEEGVEHAVEGMVEKAVAHGCFMDVAGLRVVDFEGLVGAMSVGSLCQVSMECQEVVHQPMLELLHVGFLSFAPHKLPPGGKQVLDGNDILVGMSELNTPRNAPPQSSFAACS